MTGTVTGGSVTFRAQVTGDPTAGVQQVWVTWTGSGSDSGHGHWRSIDLVQDPTDSTLWSRTCRCRPGSPWTGCGSSRRPPTASVRSASTPRDGDGYRLTQTGAVVDAATVGLRAEAPSEDSPLGVSALVTDAGQPVPDRTVIFTVSRGTTTLFHYAAQTAADGTAVLFPDGEPPFGRLVVTVDLLDFQGGIQASATTEIVMPGVNLAVAPTSMTTRAGTAFATGVAATLTDKRGPIVGVPVTFRLPSSVPSATFPGGVRTATVTTDATGVATSPVPTAGSAIGAFAMTITAEGAVDAVVPLAAQYGFTPWSGDVSNTAPTRIDGNSPTAVRVGALLADGTKISDATAAQLVTAQRVQLRWRQVGTTAWATMAGLVTYDATNDVFKADPRAHVVGWVKNKSYTVQLRILPTGTDPQPLEPLLQGSFDLGSRSFTAQIGPNA